MTDERTDDLAPAVESLEEVVERARSGDPHALEQVVAAIQDRVFGLALRMLGRRADAEDAAQEILVKVVTRLDSFRGESRFSTWVYAVATNHLRSLQSRGLERRELSFETLVENQSTRLPQLTPPTAEQRALASEVRLMCLHQLLSCLDREHRLAYVFGEHLELTGPEAAQVLGISADTFRQRLSRARKRMHGFLRGHCGLVNPQATCHCHRWVDAGVEAGAIDPADPHYSGAHGPAPLDLDPAALDGLDELARLSALWRSLPPARAPEGLLEALSAALRHPPGRRPKA